MTTDTAKQIDVEKVVAVILAEQNLIKDDYVKVVPGCESPGHCAIGALFFAAGMPDLSIYYVEAPEDWGVDSDEADLLYSHYGLRRWHAEQIILANDAAGADDGDEMALRQEAVIRRVRDLAIDQQATPERDAERCDEYDEVRRLADAARYEVYDDRE